ncbi:helix-turn-helix domain-containing protein [Humidisolicoccus flavus]|uniref:helix-turn-helix domain-containing protein n=1 Tax=Humidisolicoccus flavus TaxID=3111414 RepID=UPI00324825F8
MSPIHLRGATAEERLHYATFIKPARTRRGMSQQELAEAANIDRTTVSNIERASVAPQEDVIRRIFSALGIPTVEDVADTESDLWLAIMAGLLSAVPSERRAEAADAAISVLGAYARGEAERLSEDSRTIGQPSSVPASSLARLDDLEDGNGSSAEGSERHDEQAAKHGDRMLDQPWAE